MDRILVFLWLAGGLLAAAPAPAPAGLTAAPCRLEDWKPNLPPAPASLAPQKTPDGQDAMAFPCRMDRLEERAWWDLAAPLRLGASGRVAMWIKATGDIQAISSSTLYFNAGAGWYGAQFGPPEGEWRRVVLDRSQFIPEGQPEGWNGIRAIRLSFWKNTPGSAVVYMGGLEALSAPVVVVRNTRAGRFVEASASRLQAALKQSGIEADLLADTEVEQGALALRRLACYPNNPQVSEAEGKALETFLQKGGKILAFNSQSAVLGSRLGFTFEKALHEAYPGQFEQIDFPQKGIPGVPAQVTLAGTVIHPARPATRSARIIGEWRDQAGKKTGLPALLLSDRGAHVSASIANENSPGQTQLLRALAGKFLPDLWPRAAARALQDAAGFLAGAPPAVDYAAGRPLLAWSGHPARAGAARPTGPPPIPTQASFERTVRQILQAGGHGAAKPGFKPALAAARSQWEMARIAYQKGQYHEAVYKAAQARKNLLAAYALNQPAPDQEFRAVWCHSAFGVPGWSWDEALRVLKTNGFNAVFPNFLWGGVADYPSAILPVRDRVLKESDPLAACLGAARKHGLAVHAWKVNWNLSGAPEDFLTRLRAEGRLQMTSEGVEEKWLCPSHPANFRLELDSLLEVARKYEVDGLHLDYIRYPDQSKCYCPGCRRAFEKQQGSAVDQWPRAVLAGGSAYAAYQEFRRENINRLVQAVSTQARAVRPGIKISAAVFPHWHSCRESIGQDWLLWVRKGWLDFVCPMDYTASDREFQVRIQGQRDLVAGRIPLYPGIGASAPGLPVEQVIRQVQLVRREKLPGFMLFNFDARLATQHLPALGQGATAPAPLR
jgi:uncharacterized lipoprotein YddW (UPF0748 family)